MAERGSVLVTELGAAIDAPERTAGTHNWNRLQVALLRESLWLVGEGVATSETVDRIVRSGLARRYRYTGPFETVALGGIDSWTRVAANLFPQLSNATSLDALGRSLVYDDEALDAARVRRDGGLARELAQELDR